MVNQSKMSLAARLRPPRAIAATRRQRLDDVALMYVVSVAIAIAAMLMAAMAGS